MENNLDPAHIAFVRRGSFGSPTEPHVPTPDVTRTAAGMPSTCSLAGGPVAALARRDPELTRYETRVAGRFVTGAATFPGAGVWGASGRAAARAVLARA